MGPSDARRNRLRALSLRLAPLILLAPLLALEPSPASLGRARSCEQAQIIDGLLRCDEELPPQCSRAGEQFMFVFVKAEGCAGAPMDPETLAALGQIVDLNGASAQALTSLPGIGPTLAARIVAARPYASVDELLRVRGIGPAKLAALRARARVAQSAGAISRPRSQ